MSKTMKMIMSVIFIALCILFGLVTIQEGRKRKIEEADGRVGTRTVCNLYPRSQTLGERPMYGVYRMLKTRAARNYERVPGLSFSTYELALDAAQEIYENDPSYKVEVREATKH